MRNSIALWLAVAMCLPACTGKPGRSRPATALSQNQFVRVMVELKLSPEPERASILEKHQTTEEEIRAFVTAHARNPAVLSAAFDSVQARLDRKRQAGE